jgi:hypothetical protein
MPRKFDDYLLQRRTRVGAWLEQSAEPQAAGAVCESWIADVLDRGLMLHSRHDLESLPEDLNLFDRLSAAGLDALSAALRWQVEVIEGHEPPEAALIDHALAVAAGRAYAIQGPERLDWIGHFVATITVLLWDTFADAAAQILGERPDCLEAFSGFLDSIVAQANDVPDSVVETPPRYASMAASIESFAQAGRFQDVWDAGRWPVLFPPSGAFEIMRRADAARFVTMIDLLPHPALVKECLGAQALLASPHDVLRLLRTANPAFDADGRWQRAGMAAVLLVQLASEQLLVPRDPEDDDEGLAEAVARFTEAASAALDVLFARPDGVELAWCWLERLMRQRLSTPRRRLDGRTSQMVNRIGLLAHALANRLDPRRAQAAWIAEADLLARQFRAVAVLSVTAFTARSELLDVGSVAKGLLKGGGFELTGASELILLPGAPLRTLAGDALASIPDVATWFASTWSKLRFERECAWRATGAERRNPAQIIGLWGLGAIETLARTKRANVGDLWLAVERIFREARLIEPRLGRDFWSQGVAQLFWWWPQVFPGPLGANTVDSAALGAALAPYAEIGGDFIALIVSLQQAGISAAALDDAVCHTGRDLLHMVGRFFETARHLDDGRAWNPQWIAALRALQTQIAMARRDSLAGTTEQPAVETTPACK